ncbi:MAG: class I SAM-dependent RNA methyltransferase [Alphaproteobacteria bacterium]|nr:class I SAM-dependent RNA methyltransferase [Alphaproteobacteria bacterium]
MPELLTLSIERLGGLGDGMATHGGVTVVVPKSAAGDFLRVRVTARRQGALLAEIETVLAPGPGRAAAPCPHYAPHADHCGGCSLQHLSETAYREFKRTSLSEALRKAGFTAAPAEMVFLSAATRRRVTFTLLPRGEGGTQLSLLQSNSHRPVPVNACLLLTPALQAFLPGLHETLRGISLPASAGLQLTDTAHGIDLLFRLPAAAKPALFAPIAALPSAARVSVAWQDQLHIIAETVPVTMHLGAFDVKLPPGAFLQPTAEGQQRITDFVLRELAGCTRVADLFAGIGTYSLPLLAQARVHAFEGDAAMTAALRQAAKGETFRATRRDLFCNPLLPAELNAFDAAVINPPRAGARAQCGEIARSRVKRVAMVSCNPATFVRDATLLRQAGFRLQSALGLDQFTWSAHLEIIARFDRN